MTDLQTTYLRMKLRNPIVPSSSPLTGKLDTLRALEAAGAAAVVLPSLFEEQVAFEEMQLARLSELGRESYGEAAGGYFPELDDYNTGPSSYLHRLEAMKASLEIPVIGSLNGSTAGGWVRYARQIESVGADAIELNIYLLAADPDEPGEAVERRYLELLGEVKRTVKIPVAVKVGPYFSSMANMAVRFAEAGADGLVLFNRFYQPDIDLSRLDVSPDLKLSEPVASRLSLQWISILRAHVDVSLAATSGVHTAAEVLKLLLVGADVTMMASALLRNGVGHLATVLEDVSAWMRENDYESVEQMKGSLSQGKSPDPGAFERNNYMKVLTSYTPEVL